MLAIALSIMVSKAKTPMQLNHCLIRLCFSLPGKGGSGERKRGREVTYGFWGYYHLRVLCIGLIFNKRNAVALIDALPLCGYFCYEGLGHDHLKNQSHSSYLFMFVHYKISIAVFG